MNQDFSIPKKTFLMIPAGTYKANIASLEKTTGNFGEQIKIIFHVITEGIDGLEYTEGSVDLLAWCSTNYSERSKLFRWNRAAQAGEFNPAADFQATKMINKRVLISVEKYASANGGEFNKVIDVMAAPRGKVQAAAPQMQEPPQPPAPPDHDIPW